jgi:hypothetical protein
VGIEQLCDVLPCEGWVGIRRHRIKGGIGVNIEAEACQWVLQSIKSKQGRRSAHNMYKKA